MRKISGSPHLHDSRAGELGNEGMRQVVLEFNFIGSGNLSLTGGLGGRGSVGSSCEVCEIG